MAHYFRVKRIIMELKNITRYFPEHMPYGEGIQYFCSEDGKDFYESIPLFTRKYKLCIEPQTGIIRSIAEDVSTLYPAGFTVVETNYLPEGCNIHGGWQYKNEVVSAVPSDPVKLATSELKKRLADANSRIEVLQDACDMGIASDEEKASLLAWKKYRVELSRVNTDDAPDITWPEPPDA